MQSVYIVLVLAGLAAVCQADTHAELQSCIPAVIRDIEAIPVSQTMMEANAQMQQLFANPSINDYDYELKRLYWNSYDKFDQLSAEVDAYLSQYHRVMNNHYVCMKKKNGNEMWIARAFPKFQQQESMFRAFYEIQRSYVPSPKDKHMFDDYYHF